MARPLKDGVDYWALRRNRFAGPQVSANPLRFGVSSVYSLELLNLAHRTLRSPARRACCSPSTAARAGPHPVGRACCRRVSMRACSKRAACPSAGIQRALHEDRREEPRGDPHHPRILAARRPPSATCLRGARASSYLSTRTGGELPTEGVTPPKTPRDARKTPKKKQKVVTSKATPPRSPPAGGGGDLAARRSVGPRASSTTTANGWRIGRGAMRDWVEPARLGPQRLSAPGASRYEAFAASTRN